MISFGPVPSRRLGMSLGINNIGSPKTCSYGCIYCQVGKTMKRTIVRTTFFEPEIIYRNVSLHLRKIKPGNYPDYLTFVSNGEPTLDINLGKSIMQLKKLGLPVAVITNGSLLTNNSVCDDLALADWVSVKIDAGNESIWRDINHPFNALDSNKITERIKLFKAEFGGKLCTESMIVKGINDYDENFMVLARMIREINPWKSYLAVPIRPPSCENVLPPEPESLNRAWQIFNERNINVEFLTGFEGTDTGNTGNIYEDILNITAVHPLREEALLDLLRKDKAGYEVVESLLKQNLIRVAYYNGNKFFLGNVRMII